MSLYRESERLLPAELLGRVGLGLLLCLEQAGDAGEGGLLK